MKQKMKPAEIILLVLPTLGLAGFAIMQRSSAPTLVLEKVEVSKPRRTKNRVDATYQFDKQVVIVVKYNSPTLWGRYIDKRITTSGSAQKSGLRLVDEHGTFYFVGAQSGSVDNMPAPPRFGFKFHFDTTKIPKSAGRITFPAVIKVNDARMSVPVVVSNK